MSSVTDENSVIRVIFQRLETVRSSLLDDVELLDYFSRHCEEFIDSLRFRCRLSYYNPLRCYRDFYNHLKLLHKCQNDSICRILLCLDDAHLYDVNRSCMSDHMQLVHTESKILSLLDKIIASCVIHNHDITQGSLQEAAEIIQLSTSPDQIVAGRQALNSPIAPAFNSYVVHQGAFRFFDAIPAISYASSAVYYQDITQCPHTDAWTVRPVTPRFSESPTYSSFTFVEAFTAALLKYIRGSMNNFVRGFNEEAYSLNQINATSSNPHYFHSSAVHNHQNITQRNPGWDAGTIQLVTRISSDSLTDPIVASSADFNSVTTPEANNGTGSHNQGSPNSTRVEEEPLFNQPRFLETFLAITSQAGLTMVTIQTSGGSTSFSQNQKILFCSAAAFNVISFLSFLFVILERGRRPGIARISTGTGFLCTAYAFIGIMAMILLNDKEMLWVTGLAGVALFPVFASAFVQ